MPVLIEPDFKVPDIVIEKDANDPNGTDTLLTELGRTIPVMSVNGKTVKLGSVEHMELKYSLNSLPRFEIEIFDEDFYVRELLKEPVDLCTVFWGYKEFYIKFNGLISNTYSDSGSRFVTIFGDMYIENMYGRNTAMYLNKSVQDIFKELCTAMKCGLVSRTGNYLDTVTSEIQYGNRNIDFFTKVLQDNTNLVWSMDWHGYIHVADIEQLRSAKVDEYTMDSVNGVKFNKAYPIKLRQRTTSQEHDEHIIIVDGYTNGSTRAASETAHANKYFINSTELSSPDHGKGEHGTNTFSAWLSKRKPFYQEIVNKKLATDIVKCRLPRPVIELMPMAVVDFEAYFPAESAREIQKDETASGKKICISSALIYNKPLRGEKTGRATHELELI